MEEENSFSNYFRNLKPKEIRNALINFRNEMATNTKDFKKKCIKHGDILNLKHLYFTQIIKGCEDLMIDLSQINNNLKDKENKQQQSSALYEFSTSSSIADSVISLENKMSESLEKDIFACYEYHNLIETGQIEQSYERIIQLEERLINKFVKICNSFLNQSIQFDSYDELLDQRISEQLTFLFIVMYIFRDCIDTLFLRAEKDNETTYFTKLAEKWQQQSQNITKSGEQEIMIYQIFKSLVLEIHLYMIQTALESK